MKLRKLALTASLAAIGLSTALGAYAQAKEQFFPVLVYRTGAYGPNGTPWANGYVDYLKLVNARGGINGVKISFEALMTPTSKSYAERPDSKYKEQLAPLPSRISRETTG